MTVQELIATLTALPADLPVMVDGYEGGVADCVIAAPTRVVLHQHTASWYGPHEELRADAFVPAGAVIVDAVVLR